MSQAPRQALTLIELLISISLGMVLLAISSTALVRITHIAKRDGAHRQAHDDVATIYRHVQDRMVSMHHASQTRVEAHPGEDQTWGTGDEVLSLIWMSVLRDRDEHGLNIDRRYDASPVWNQLQWVGDGAGGGELRFAVSSPTRSCVVTSVGSDGKTRDLTLTNHAQPRRDRRRDLNDNDLRWVPGMTGVLLDTIDLPGDRDDLENALFRIHPPTTEVSEVVFEWIDAGGVVVRCDAMDGITVNGAPPPNRKHGTVTWSGTDPSLSTTDPDFGKLVYVVDGTFLDGRAYTHDPEKTRRALAERPCLVSLRCTMIPTTAAGLELDQEPHLPFTLTFNTTPQLPLLP